MIRLAGAGERARRPLVAAAGMRGGSRDRRLLPPAQNECFPRRRGQQPAAIDAYPACRTARFAAADAGVGDSVAKTCLEHAQSTRHPYRSIRIAQADEATAAFAQATNAARHEDETDRARIGEQKIVPNGEERSTLCRCTQMSWRAYVCGPFRVLREDSHHGLALLVETKQREQRQQNGRQKQVWSHTWEPGL